MSSIIDTIARGGWLMIPILLCSVVSLAIILERLIRLRRAEKENQTFLRDIRGRVRVGKVDEAIAICERTPSPLSRIFAAGLRRVSDGEDRTRQAIEEAGRNEAVELEKHLGTLSTIAGGAPLLGFLGTVLGMIEAFQQVERLGGGVNASVLAGGIWQALLTTAAGLMVAAPTFFFHNFLYGRIRDQVRQMEESSQELMLLLVTGDESIL